MEIKVIKEDIKRILVKEVNRICEIFLECYRRLRNKLFFMFLVKGVC
ncbi:hypothetical protein TDIS_2052 [Thermosulfurimonas dismutans]|uniref:Uncharacterized protein n=1 Tax=Thermosulfurimonas dismutans TaxID=999894 RepID=A0A179D330_9BACT|nr:hypothetical protein TDIS_2052 [Thermosulfurimonas dismutans]